MGVRGCVSLVGPLLLFVLLAEAVVSEEQWLHNKYITIKREKRAAEAVVVKASDGDGDLSPVDDGDDDGDDDARVKRGVENDDSTTTTTTTPRPIVNVSHLNDSHYQIMIQWAGQGSSVIVCLLRDTVQNSSKASGMFISRDYGSTYQDIGPKFVLEDDRPAIVSTYYKNKVFNSRFVFVDVLNGYIFVTKDYAATIRPHKVEFTPSDVVFHPLNAEVLFIHDTQDTERKLWLSEDFGTTWRIIGRYVKSFFISEFTSPPTVYLERKEGELASVISSQDLFREGALHTVVLESILEFEVKDEFLFAVKKSTSSEDTLRLLVSYRGGQFQPAEFPNNMTHRHYYIADVSEGQVMVCVAHGDYLSNLYVSSVPRSPRHPVKFSLSLERIVFYHPSRAWEGVWISDVAEKQFADLHRVEGIRGVFIASQLWANMTTTNTTSRLRHIRPEHTVSYISFDQGAQWKLLKPPRRDVYGRMIDCKRSKGCSLQVGQFLSYYDPRTETIPVVSKESAPGLVLATGSIGATLKDHTSLYVSVDAGINWHQALQGSYRYVMGDHGGILVAVQHFRIAGEVDSLYYSTDDGESWNTFKFSDEKLRIYGLLTEPGENTTVFTLFGSRSETHRWIFIKVDLRPVFTRKCSSEDYKLWSPSDDRRGRQCLLGRKQVYERRVPNSNCYSSVNYDRPVSTQNCPCDREDFECDFGFVLEEGSHKCIQDPRDSVDPYAIPASCAAGEFFNRTKGYRLIPGDTCQGGRDYQYLPTITACPLQEEREFLLVSARQVILRFDLVNPEASLQPLPIPHLSMVIALDFDLASNCIFWSDVSLKKIFRLCFDGAHDVEVLVETDLQSVEGLAYDWVAKNLYFVDGERKTLEVIRTDLSNFGRMRRTLLTNATLDNPRGIAVHPQRGFLYITDWSETSPKVARAFLDGTNFTTLFGAGQVGWPNGITIDFQDERIFFVDAKLDFIASADLNGEHMRKIITNSEKVSQPFAVGIYKSTMFWDDWTVEKVLQADKIFGWGISPIANFTRNGLVDLKVYGHWSQQGSNACGNKTHGCKYLCMARPNDELTCLCPDSLQQKSGSSMAGEECLCPNGLPVDDSGVCKSLNSTCPPDFFKCNNDNCIPDKWVCDKDNDCGDNSDESLPRCGSVPCFPPYWQCRDGGCILPTYQCDHHPDCDDGSDEENCHYEPCANDNTTFRCDNGKCIHRLWRCDLEDDCRDGSDEVNCTVKPDDSQCKGTEFQCQDQRCIPMSWQCDGDSDCADNSDESHCQSFTCSAWQFACKGNSSEIKCIFKNWHCDGEKDCDDGSDEVNCTSAVTTTTTTTTTPATDKQCAKLMFRCGNGHCIPFWWRCDDLDDCGDASDEQGCPDHGSHTTLAPPSTTAPPTCAKNQFQCSSGLCIWEAWVCDGDYDCAGAEDESNCPQVNMCFSRNEFLCRRSGGCIPATRFCDGHNDCPDGSDEEGCTAITTPASSCGVGYLTCDGGACLPLFVRCNGIHDCSDLSDEQNCTDGSDKVYAVSQYTVSSTNVSVSVAWQVNSLASPPPGLEYLLSYTTKTTPGTQVIWNNMTWTPDTNYEVQDLSPFTTYVVKVYIRETNSSRVFPPILSKNITTKQGKPSPPQAVKVEREIDRVRVSWQPPSTPGGIIRKYHIFVDPPPPSETHVTGRVKEMTIPLSVMASSAVIWVTAENDEYTSEPSNRVPFHWTVVDTTLSVQAKNRSSSSVTLAWDAVQGVDGYTVRHDRPENVYIMGNVTTNTSESSVEVTGLAPGLTYTFWVRPYKGQLVGPETEVRVNTLGKKLVPVKSLRAVVTKEGTTVKLSWMEPSYKALKVSWVYRIIWGKTPTELKHSTHLSLTPNTTFTIRGLDPCESYHLAVMVGQPIGIGPVQEKQVWTGADPKAAPKNLRARLDNMTLVMTWEQSCLQQGADDHQYLLFITDTLRNATSHYKLQSSKNETQSHWVRAHWGGHYSIQVRTAVEGAALTPPVLLSGPQIPPPFELEYNPSNSSLSWRNSPNLPKEIASGNYTYVLYVSRHLDLSEADTLQCERPPLLLDSLDKGVVYFVAVALKDQEGCLSLRSQLLNIERPIDDELVISQGSAVGVGVSVFLVVVALAVVMGILVVRHRRLARSLIAFTNTHYDTSCDTTVITTDHNLDEDDDSPMIRGFSDDEPLIIA